MVFSDLLSISTLIALFTLAHTISQSVESKALERSLFCLKKIENYLDNAVKLLKECGNDNVSWHLAYMQLRESIDLSKKLKAREHKRIFLLSLTMINFHLGKILEMINTPSYFFGIKDEVEQEELGKELNGDLSSITPKRALDILNIRTRISPNTINYFIHLIRATNQYGFLIDDQVKFIRFIRKSIIEDCNDTYIISIYKNDENYYQIEYKLGSCKVTKEKNKKVVNDIINSYLENRLNIDDANIDCFIRDFIDIIGYEHYIKEINTNDIPADVNFQDGQFNSAIKYLKIRKELLKDIKVVITESLPEKVS